MDQIDRCYSMHVQANTVKLKSYFF